MHTLPTIFLISAGAVALLAGCASSTPKPVKLPSQGGGANTLSIGYKSELPDGYYVVIDKSSGRWTVTDISRSRIKRRPNAQSEILFFDKRLQYAQPAFEYVKYYNGSTFSCSPLLIDKSAYTPCTSSLMGTDVGMSVGKNILAAGLTLGLAAGYHAVVDRKKVGAAIDESGAIRELRRAMDQVDREYEYKLAAQRREQVLEAEAELQAQRRELAARRAMLPEMLQIGAMICQDQATRYGAIRYTGYVERIAGERVQIRVAFANVPGSSLSPGGFQPHIIWDEAVNWYPCR
jgi:hypothetical protein